MCASRAASCALLELALRGRQRLSDHLAGRVLVRAEAEPERAAARAGLARREAFGFAQGGRQRGRARRELVESRQAAELALRAFVAEIAGRLGDDQRKRTRGRGVLAVPQFDQLRVARETQAFGVDAFGLARGAFATSGFFGNREARFREQVA